MQRVECWLVVEQENRLGDLQLQAMGSQTRVRQSIDYGLGQARGLELHRRKVHRNADIIGPFCGFLTSLPKDPFPNRHNQPRFFSEWDEIKRRHNSALGMVPPNERL